MDKSIRNYTVPRTEENPDAQYLIEMVICSFALHLVETPSNLFALLWQLSLRARWLVILAPHKKPEVLNLS
jgi:cell division inhibitor SulA